MVSKTERLQQQYAESMAKAKTAKAALDKIRRDQDRKEKIAARKARNHALFMVGGLVEIAGLLDTDKGALLGGLLTVAESLKAGPGSSPFQPWKHTGDALLAERAAARKPATMPATPRQPRWEETTSEAITKILSDNALRD